MKKTLLMATSLVLLAGASLAADLPSRKVELVSPPPPMWTGFYLGLNAGYGFSTNNQASSQAYPLADRLANDINALDP